MASAREVDQEPSAPADAPVITPAKAPVNAPADAPVITPEDELTKRYLDNRKQVLPHCSR